MRHFKLNTGLITAAVASGLLFSASAQAGEPHTIKDWAQEAGKQISKKMSYSTISLRRNQTGATQFHVTVDRDGNILDQEMVTKTKYGLINSASKRALKNADFPELPSSYEGETLRFSLNMNYAIAADNRGMKRTGRVTGSSVNEQFSSSLRILDNPATAE